MKTTLKTKVNPFYILTMRTGKYFLLPILALILSTSCDKHSQVVLPEETFTVSSITAEYTSVNVPETKNEIGRVYYEVTWTTGDKIAIVNMDNGAIHSYTVKASSVGKVNGVFIADATYAYTDGDHLVAVYPFNAASWSDNKLYVTVKNEVEYHSATDIPAFAANDIQVSKVMTGSQFKALVESSSSLSFDRMVALISTTCVVSSNELRSKTASEFAICHNGICGTAEVQFDGEGKPSVAASSGTGENSNRLVVALTPGHAMNGITYVVKFIPVFPLNENNGFAFVLRTEDDFEAGFYLKQDRTINSNKHQSFIIYDGNYTPVDSQAEATSHHQWWYRYLNADKFDAEAGGFTSAPGASLDGNGAGSFTSAPEASLGGNSAGSFTAVPES